ncbi:substrate-binding domain-containing protein [Maribacter sp. 2308TA10-17]|uniref:substrate-binding domain-containing protein n=1 Tax=Maribacter sp. 2308TA10-17 TaxID=3386276 RepID=UPI0039BC4D94
MDKKYTIKDIAELAGVSKGTVDRVLHQRGKVSSKSLEQVQKVLKEIDYQPNPIARNLKNNKVYKICILMPDPEQDAYWYPAVQGIRNATNEFKPFGLSVSKFYYDPYNRDSFIEKSQKALKSPLDALLIVPLFQKEAQDIYKQCQEKKVLVASFNNTIDTFNPGNFIGQDLYQSGRVAASLIEKLVDEKAIIGILHLDEEANMKLREKGFKSYFEKKTNPPKISTFSLRTSDREAFKKEAVALVESNSKISAIFVTNSKAYHFIQAIDHLCKDITIVGYDLLDENINFLKTGCIDFLIHQKPKRQAYLGVGYLAEHFLFGKPIPSENLLPIDIITSENVAYYLD